MIQPLALFDNNNKFPSYTNLSRSFSLSIFDENEIRIKTNRIEFFIPLDRQILWSILEWPLLWQGTWKIVNNCIHNKINFRSKFLNQFCIENVSILVIEVCNCMKFVTVWSWRFYSLNICACNLVLLSINFFKIKIIIVFIIQ